MTQQQERIPFNAWSRERIRLGMQYVTSRKRIWNDPRVFWISPQLPLWFIAQFLYKAEGAWEPLEFRRVVNQIFRRKVEDDELFYVHFGHFEDEVRKEKHEAQEGGEG